MSSSLGKHSYKRCTSVQSLDRSGRQGDVTDDSAQTLFQRVLQKATLSSSGMGCTCGVHTFVCLMKRKFLENLHIVLSCLIKTTFVSNFCAFRSSFRTSAANFMSDVCGETERNKIFLFNCTKETVSGKMWQPFSTAERARTHTHTHMCPTAMIAYFC